MNTDLSLLDQALAFAQARNLSLPVFSDVALEIQAAARDEEVELSEIERLISQDPALVAELLRQANSAFFGGLSEVASVRAAILRLGRSRVANLVFLATEKSRYTAREPRIAALMQDLWRHASACALAAEWIARRVRYPQLGETVFIGGLVHDIGKLFLLRVLDAMAQDGADEGIPMTLVGEVLDQAHAEIGHRLLVSWNLPDVYQVIVRDHHLEQVAPTQVPLNIVRLANHACNKVGIGLRTDDTLVLSSLPESAVLGMNEVALAELEILLEDTGAAA
jgi:HD-like signal output (HDOD) protein